MSNGEETCSSSSRSEGNCAAQRPLSSRAIPHHRLMMVCRDHGSSAMAVLQVLAQRHQDDGVELPLKDIVAETGLGESTVKRAVSQLVHGGLITSEPQFENNRQLANRYRIMAYLLEDRDGPGLRNGPLQGAQNGLAIGITTPIDISEKSIKYVDVLPAAAAADLRSAGAHRDPLLDQVPICWPPKGSPMPEGDPRRSLFARWDQACWLVSFFEERVLERQNVESLASGRKPPTSIPEKRKRAWVTNATSLLGRVNAPRLVEVCEVISWVFEDWDGFIPFPVENHLGYSRPRDRKLTHIRVVEENWDRLVSVWKSRHSASKSCHGTDFDEHTQNTTASDQTKWNKSEPSESEVTELVDLFDQFRRGQSDEDQRQAWAKTFKIMLRNDQKCFTTLRDVIGGLAAVEDYLDTSRYLDAFDVREDYEFLRETVPIYVAISKRRSIAIPKPNLDSYDECPADTVDIVRRRYADGPTTSDMSNVEDRRAWYESGAGGA